VGKHPKTIFRSANFAFTLVELLVVITIIGILIALLLPAVQAARESARRMQCTNNFKQVGLALHNYHSVKGCFPPGMFSTPGYWGWSSFLLPYLEQQGVYDMFDFNTDYFGGSGSAMNPTRQANGTFISAYMCPDDPQAGEWVISSSGASVGPDPDDDSAMTDMCGVSDTVDWLANGWPIAFPTIDGIFGADRPCAIADIRDGTSNTLMVGEVTGKGRGTRRGHFWPSWNILDTRDGINGPFTVPGGTYPDATFGCLESGFASFHPGGCNFAVADGSAHFVSQNIADATLKALATRDGTSRRSYRTPATETLISGVP
jgi:prepilin-type N-terminal cleavage/methylation domain-containing protein